MAFKGLRRIGIQLFQQIAPDHLLAKHRILMKLYFVRLTHLVLSRSILFHRFLITLSKSSLGPEQRYPKLDIGETHRTADFLPTFLFQIEGAQNSSIALRQLAHDERYDLAQFEHFRF